MIKSELPKKVEELGIFFESFDNTPTAARIIAYLFLVEPHYQDFDTIREFLQASKSTISTSLNALSKKGSVDYMTLPGDRKRYFKINPSRWLELTKKSLGSVTAIESKLSDVLAIRNKSESPEFYKEIKELREFYLHLDKYLVKAVADWEKKK